MTESAEAIAKAIADARRGRVEHNLDKDDDYNEVWKAWMTIFADPLVPLVDATDIWKQYMASDGARPYEDHVLRPPWPEVIIGYQNSYLNVNLMQVICAPIEEVSETVRWNSLADHTISWDEVKWVYHATLWIGGYSTTNKRYLPVTGPMFAWSLAVNEDGTMQDLKWTNYSPQQPEVTRWDPSIMTMLAVINYLNCVNVELVTPHRSRAAQKRISRHLPDTQVSEIRVHPISQSRRNLGTSSAGSQELVPLHVVRGHFARYGPEFDRGLLFGKYAGRFWIQGHARGSAEAGTRLHAYTPEPE